LCHSDRVKQGIAQQKAFFAQQATVEKLLADSAKRLGRIAAAGRNRGALYEDALDAHRQAHVRWENLAVSENSMGFHNFEEATATMKEAERQVRSAIRLEKQLERD
jgi:nitrite reductase (cytochrome c-552)